MRTPLLTTTQPIAWMVSLLVLTLGSDATGKEPSASVSDNALARLLGSWEVRIDGGGEIYSALFELEEVEGEIQGLYEAAGRKGRVLSVRREDKVYFIEVQTRRSSLPTTGSFVFEIVEDRWKGDVDFEAGASVRSYEFQAQRLPDSAPTVGGVPEVVTSTNSATPAIRGDNKPATPSKQVRAHSKGPGARPIEKEFRRRGSAHFQNGLGGYKSMVDTEIWGIAPSKALDRQGTLTADGNNGGGESQVLMQFGDIFGDGANQVPHNCRVLSAKLTIIVFDPGSTVYLHRMLVPWDASATWNGMAAGVSVDNIEACTVRDGFSFGEITMDKQMVEFDVTQTVQKWADGAANHGWVFVNTGGNGWDFYSSDWLEENLRPQLEIEYEIRGATPTPPAVATHTPR